MKIFAKSELLSNSGEVHYDMLYTAEEDVNLWLDNFHLVRRTEEHSLFFSSNFFVSTPCINTDVRYYLIENNKRRKRQNKFQRYNRSSCKIHAVKGTFQSVQRRKRRRQFNALLENSPERENYVHNIIFKDDSFSAFRFTEINIPR